jgi:methionine synthase II (cobalamin-independent)
VPWQLLRGAGARGLSADLEQLDAGDMDVFAEALDAGETVALGVVPALQPAHPPTATGLTEQVLRWLDMTGLDPGTVSDRLVLTPACGLAGASPAWARQALALCHEAATNLSG